MVYVVKEAIGETGKRPDLGVAVLMPGEKILFIFRYAGIDACSSTELIVITGIGADRCAPITIGTLESCVRSP
jgi:hypothetical protein